MLSSCFQSFKSSLQVLPPQILAISLGVGTKLITTSLESCYRQERLAWKPMAEAQNTGGAASLVGVSKSVLTHRAQPGASAMTSLNLMTKLVVRLQAVFTATTMKVVGV